MTDYFFPYCDARAELAGVKVTIEGYLRALESGYELQQEVYLKILAEAVESIQVALDKEV
jgi:hypothetical protein